MEVVSFTTPAVLPQLKSPWYKLDRRLDEPQSRSGRGCEEKNSPPLPGLEAPIIQTVAQGYTTELSLLFLALVTIGRRFLCIEMSIMNRPSPNTNFSETTYFISPVVTGEKNSPIVAHACRKRRLKWVLSAWGNNWATQFPDPPGWGLGMGLTTPPRKKSTVRKPKMWPRNSQIDCIEITGRSPLRRWRSALDCRAI
jgi:hypothetical protein